MRDIMIIEKGRVCIVRRGRDFGKLCCVTEVSKDKSKVKVEGLKLKPGLKNISHLWFVDKVVNNTKDLEKVKL